MAKELQQESKHFPAATFKAIKNSSYDGNNPETKLGWTTRKIWEKGSPFKM